MVRAKRNEPQRYRTNPTFPFREGGSRYDPRLRRDKWIPGWTNSWQRTRKYHPDLWKSLHPQKPQKTGSYYFHKYKNWADRRNLGGLGQSSRNPFKSLPLRRNWSRWASAKKAIATLRENQPWNFPEFRRFKQLKARSRLARKNINRRIGGNVGEEYKERRYGQANHPDPEVRRARSLDSRESERRLLELADLMQ